MQTTSDISDYNDQIKKEIQSVVVLANENSEKIEEIIKVNAEKKAMMNFPMALDDPKKRKNLDEEVIIDALDKMRDYISLEVKKIKDDFFKFQIEFEGKIREKLDKKDLEDIESKALLPLSPSILPVQRI